MSFIHIYPFLYVKVPEIKLLIPLIKFNKKITKIIGRRFFGLTININFALSMR